MKPPNVNHVNSIRLETLICFLAIIVLWVRRTEAAPSHPQARPALIELPASAKHFTEASRPTPNWCGTRMRLPPIKLDVTEC